MSLPMAGLAPPLSLELRGPVWGVDTQMTRISVAEIAPTPEGVKVRWVTVSVPQGRNLAVRFAGLASRLRPALETFLIRRPWLVLVEEPFGGNRKAGQDRVHPNSQRVLGVTLAVVGVVLGVTPAPDIHLTQSTSWKAKALGQGHGFAKPPDYLRWAQECAGYTGELEDEAAAIGIATAGGVLLSLERETG